MDDVVHGVGDSVVSGCKDWFAAPRRRIAGDDEGAVFAYGVPGNGAVAIGDEPAGERRAFARPNPVTTQTRSPTPLPIAIVVALRNQFLR